MNMNTQPAQDIRDEQEWHDRKFYVDSGHWTSHPLFASRERHWLYWQTLKIRFYGLLYRCIKDMSFCQHAEILMAPVGNGGDLQCLQGIYKSVSGIDLSSKALQYCPNVIVKKEGNILDSGYPDQRFDVVVCSLFLHHVHKEGFAPFVKEFFRILKPGGVLAVLEPSALYPLVIPFRLLEKVMGNVSGKVCDERPILPLKLNKIITEAGFINLTARGMSFSHPRLPSWIQNVFALIDYPLRVLPLVKYCSSAVAWVCKKPVENVEVLRQG